MIKQVNALIDHRVEKEKQILKGVGKKKKKIGGSGAKNAGKKQRNTQRSTQRSKNGGASSTRKHQDALKEPTIEVAAIIEEDEQDGSAREKLRERELNELNDMYKNEADEPESQNIERMLKLGQKLVVKNAAHEPEPFMPFTSPYTEQVTQNEIADG